MENYNLLGKNIIVWIENENKTVGGYQYINCKSNFDVKRNRILDGIVVAIGDSVSIDLLNKKIRFKEEFSKEIYFSEKDCLLIEEQDVVLIVK